MPVSAAAPLDIGEQQEEAVFEQALAEGDIQAVEWLLHETKEDQDYQRLLALQEKGTELQNLYVPHPTH